MIQRKNKPIAKKNVIPKKANKKISPQRVKLEKDLKDHILKLNDDSLIYLLKQAHVLLHNMQVDKINMEIVDLESSRKKGKGRKPEKAVARPLAEIKPAADNKSFIIVMANARKIFSLQEMKRIVGICEAARSEADASARLYSWFSQNRKDVLGDVGIGNSRHPVLAALYKLVKSTYKTRK